MDFSRNGVNNKLKDSSSLSEKIFNKLILILIRILLAAALMCCIFAVSTGLGIFMGIIDNTPDVNIDSIVPMGYATNIYDSKGNLTDTLVMEGSNREEVTYEELPEDLINAFVAIEDSRFWVHNGVDLRGIIRAFWGIVSGDNAGGGSTITQQLIKNNVFGGGRETSFGAKLERKFQEQYLAIELEKKMDKKLILTNYLNTINLGSNSLGVKVAAHRYFNKDVSDLTLSECAVIAGITQNPSKLNPISGREKNAEKRQIILKYMEEQGYITARERQEALNDPVYERIQNVDIVTQESVRKVYSYFTDELIDQLTQTFVDELGYSETQAHNLLYSGGLSIYTSQDPDMQAIVDEEINDPANYVTTTCALTYRLSIQNEMGEKTHYSEKHVNQWLSENGGSSSGLFENEDAARAAAEAFKESVIQDTDKIIGESFSTTLEPQTSFVLIDQKTGQVKAISGGRGEKKSSLSFSRAGDSLRQPGSTFKVLSAFAPAVESGQATLGTVYYDAPFTVGAKSFRNWYSSGYMGWSNIRDGIIYSMNIVAVRCLMETVSPQMAVDYLKRFGITSLTDTDYNASTALGGITYGVSNLELTGAYAAIANKGQYNKPVFYTRVLDHSGKVLLEYAPEQRKVLSESTAFLMTDAMEDSMVPNHMYARPGVSLNSTSTSAHLDNMSCAGKSGTTSNNYDIWFVGFTPYYTAGIWAGYDNNENTLSGQTSFHKQIWKKIMDRLHADLSDPGFPVPDDIVTCRICRKSGKLAIDGMCDCDPRGSAVYTEYFAAGTAPTEYCDHHTSVTVCAESLQHPTEFCPLTVESVAVICPESDEETDDSVLLYREPCPIHIDESSLIETVPFIFDPSTDPSLVGPGYIPNEGPPVQQPSAVIVPTAPNQ